MTEGQKSGLLGLAFGCALIAALVVLVGSLPFAGGLGQSLAYAGFTFVLSFITARFVLLRMARKYEPPL